MVESINAKKTIKQIRRGLSIYRTGRSPFWHARIYDPVKKKYVVRSTKETNRIEAIEVAEEILETYKSKQNSSHATSKDRSFEYYAKLLADLNAQKSKSPRNKYTERDQNNGLVPLTFRSLNSFMQPFVQMPRGFCRLGTSGGGVDCRSR